MEIDAYCASVLIQRQNDGILSPFPVWDDVRTFDGKSWQGIVDVVSGGFPCQAYSTATAGKSIADDLWPEMRRIVADVAPWYVFAENVSRKAIEAVAEDLEAMGYKTKAIALSAADMGGDHIRRRFWLRAYADCKGKFCGEVDAEMGKLPEFCGGFWQTEPGKLRVSNGMGARVDRTKALGNGQVPAVAAEAWRVLNVESVRNSHPMR